MKKTMDLCSFSGGTCEGRRGGRWGLCLKTLARGMIPLDPRLLGEFLLFLGMVNGRKKYFAFPPTGATAGVQGVTL